MASFATPAAILLLLLFCSPFLAAADEVSYVGKAGLFTLLDCGGGASSSDGGDSAAAPPSSKNESADVISEFLAAVPSVAAPEGFGALSRGGASVRGVCVGESSPESCRACLIDAAWSLTKGCGLSLRRAGAWTNNCFVAYAYAAGTNATAASIAGGRKVLCHGDFSGLYVDGGEDTVFRYAAFPEQTLSSLATDLARRAAGDRARMAHQVHAAGALRSLAVEKRGRRRWRRPTTGGSTRWPGRGADDEEVDRVGHLLPEGQGAYGAAAPEHGE
ncbi:unnamed protein product [Urochloa humidicola]